MSKDTKNSNSKSDWEQDDEDDNDWDDWGDAEESNEIKITEEEASNKLYTKTNSTASNSLSESKETPTTTTTQERNANKQNRADLLKEEIEKSQAAETRSSWGLWGSKLTSVLSTATEGLGNITTTVSQGLNQVIGVPDPEDMARIHAAEMAKLKQQKATTPSEATDSPVEECKTEHEDNNGSNAGVPVFGLNLVSGVTTLGSKVLNTGLDTLEGIGKKTMDLLQENDPHLKNKRKLLGLETEKPNLSEILKEAKKDAETIENTLKELKLEKSKAALCFDVLFENYCGLVHLEALEILSKESKLKLQKLIDAVSGNALAELQETLDEVKELFELDDLEGESEGDYDADELTERFNTAIADLELPVRFDDIAIIWTQSLKWLEDEASTVDDYAAFGKGITSLAETCALSMSKLHKIAELLLVKDHHSTANEVDGIVQLCKQFTTHLSGLTTRFAATLTARQNDEAKAHVTTLFSELVLAMQQIEKAFNLFLPILQIGAV